MAPQPTPVISDETLPDQTDVIVIGGGIIGVTTALELAERGIAVTLLEKGIIAGEQSSRNWGWVRQMGRDPSEIPLIVKSTELWKGLSRRIGTDVKYQQCGITYLLNNEKDIAHYSHWSEHHARPGGITSQIIGQEKIDQLFPHNTASWKAGLYTADDGRAEPQLAAPAIAEAARRHGAKIFTNCAVRGVEKAAGRIAGVVTEKGTIKCHTILLAGGAWSRHFCARLGISLPQLTTISSVLRTKAMDGPKITASGEHYTFRKRDDGGYTITPDVYSYSQLTPAHFRHFLQFLPLAIKNFNKVKVRLGKRFFDEVKFALNTDLDKISPFEQVRIFDPAPVNWMLDQALTNLKRDFPVFEPLKEVERWAGCIDVTPDEVPIIDAVASLPGFYIATGSSGHGFGIGPAAGKLSADIITGDKPCVDPGPFRFDRF
ncbi:MAG TPA: FAD-binding oxidoreductase [Rhizobiales bacterium]|nr:FAD-binding oxidoreductase [Hyphomicrobiales bacterium]